MRSADAQKTQARGQAAGVERHGDVEGGYARGFRSDPSPSTAFRQHLAQLPVLIGIFAEGKLSALVVVFDRDHAFFAGLLRVDFMPIPRQPPRQNHPAKLSA